MPQRSIKQPADSVVTARPADPVGTLRPTGHYFDSAHGDVAALHARIEQGFRDNGFVELPTSVTGTRIDSGIEQVSRGAGVLGLVGALTAIAYWLV